MNKIQKQLTRQMSRASVNNCFRRIRPFGYRIINIGYTLWVLMLFSRAASTLSRADETKHFPVVVLGGGAGGCSMASRLCRLMGPGNVAVVEPSKVLFFID